MTLRGKTARDLPVLLREDGRLELTEARQRVTRWGVLTAFRGHVTDLASVPFFMRGLIANSGRRVNLPAIFHDLCCDDLNQRHKEGRTLDPEGLNGPICGPRETDVMFREYLRELGNPVLLAEIYWEGVRWGAVANPARRPGWWRDFPRLLLVTALTSWFVVPAGLTALFFLAVYTLAALVVDSTVRIVRGSDGGTDRGADRLGAPSPD